MKRLLLILILTLSFQSWTKADDIRDFEIEGMSIGDSALDYYSKKELRKFDKTYYPKSKKFYLREFFKEIKPVKKDFKHPDDKSKNSIVKILQFDVSGGSIAVKYTNWSNTMNYSDNVTVDVNTIESDEWMMSNYGID